MVDVLRWGRSAYETDADLALEQAAALGLGLSWRSEPSVAPPVDLGSARLLVVTSGVRVDAEVVAAFGGELVLTTTSGHDHIDVAACAAKGVAVGRCPLARRDAVVEVALASMITLRRRLFELHEAASAGRWARADLPRLAPMGLGGVPVVVVGLGVIGARMADVLEALGAEVREVDPFAPMGRRRRWEPDAALAGAQVVTLHCALSPTSRGWLDRRRLDLLARGAAVVNTARGDVLDVGAAVDGVRRGALGGLAVDVFPEEPHPRLAEDSLPGILLTPHSAGFTADLGRRVAAEVGVALRSWVEGRVLPASVLAG